MQESKHYSRRQILKSTLALAGAGAFLPAWDALASVRGRGYNIGACDWSIGMHSKVEAMALAEKIGLDGVQVSLGNVQNNMHLRMPEVQKAYKQAAKKHKVKVSSLAIGELNNIPYKSAPQTEEWVSDSIDVAKAMGCKVVLLAFFGVGDLKGDKAGTTEVIRRLKKVAPKAEKAGVILGIESWLSADEHLEIINAVESDSVRVYYDVANSNHMGYDIYEEMERLGSKYICEIHAKENGYLLGQGKVDFERVNTVLNRIDYKGWVIIEGAVPQDTAMFDAYQANNAYLRKVLNRS